MSLKRWRKISEETRTANPWWKYKLDVFQLPSEKRGEYHYVHTNGSSMVIAQHDDGTLVMVKQYRYLNNRESFEFVCGGVKDGHSYDDTVRKELAEEAGLYANKFECIGEFNPYNGVTNEICKVYVATDLTPFNSSPDETEEFEVVRIHCNEIDELIRKRIVWDGMTLAAWSLFQTWERVKT